VHDYHVHSNYSDGDFLSRMVSAADRAGLDGIGIADHCAVSERDPPVVHRHDFGFNLDLTYERRREAIERLRERFDLRVYDAVEMDYDPRDEDAIAAFLDEADFEYAVGSVHELDGVNVHNVGHFSEMTDVERRSHVEAYFEALSELVASDLFDVVAHPDIVERNAALRGFATGEQYHRVARALADADAVPEINAGRVLDDYGEFHPHPDFLDVFAEHDVGVTVGSDSHDPSVLEPRLERIRGLLEERGLEPVRIVE